MQFHSQSKVIHKRILSLETLTSPHDDPGRGLPGLFDGVPAGFPVEARLHPTEDLFKLSEDRGVLVEFLVDLPPTLSRRAPVEEHVLFPGVAVKVAEQEDRLA